MKRVAMVLCLVLAFGWISNTGILSIRYDNGSSISGIPIWTGHDVTFSYLGTKTTIACQNPALQWSLFHFANVYVNGKFVPATPLGNGFLFKFKAVGGGNVSGLPNH
jgi:hypothetical protein